MQHRLNLLPLMDLLFAGVGIFLLLFSLISVQSPRSREPAPVDLFLLLEGNGDWVRAVTPDRQEWRMPRHAAPDWVKARAAAGERALRVVLGIPAGAIRAAQALSGALRDLGRVADPKANAGVRPVRVDLLTQALGRGPAAPTELLAGWLGD